LAYKFEVDFASKGMDADDFYSERVAETEFAPVAAALDGVFFFIIVIVVVAESGEADEALDEIAVQLHEEAEVS
jgi:hypothetical protein